MQEKENQNKQAKILLKTILVALPLKTTLSILSDQYNTETKKSIILSTDHLDHVREFCINLRGNPQNQGPSSEIANIVIAIIDDIKKKADAKANKIYGEKNTTTLFTSPTVRHKVQPIGPTFPSRPKELQFNDKI